ncbi:hypothetical protein WJX74_009633 [Apatococcus lobatus]
MKAYMPTAQRRPAFVQLAHTRSGQLDCSLPSAHQLQSLRMHGLWRAAPVSVAPLSASRSRASATVRAASALDMTEERPRVTVFGTGLMGSKAAQRLAAEGFQVTAWNRNTAKAEALVELGLDFKAAQHEAVEECDVAVLFLADADAIESILFSNSKALEALRGKTVLQMGTIGPDQSRKIGEQLAENGVKYIEAPVQGSHPEAYAGTLVIMVGADEDPQALPAWNVIKALGKDPIFVGAVGQAAAIKLALNQLVAALTVAFSTSLGLVERNGAPVDKFMELLRGSKVYAPTFDKKLPLMLDRSYGKANFPTKHLLKDIKLFNEEARSSMLNTDFLEGLESLINTTVNAGLENSDYSSVYEGVSPPVNTLVHPPSSEDAFVVIDPVGPRTATPVGKKH